MKRNEHIDLRERLLEESKERAKKQGVPANFIRGKYWCSYLGYYDGKNGRMLIYEAKAKYERGIPIEVPAEQFKTYYPLKYNGVTTSK